MKCPKCGVDIANDSNFCEYCGAKVIVAKAKKTRWIIIAVILSLCVIGGVIGYFLYNSDNIPNTGIMTDAQQMNIHGSIKKITEKSYYTIEAENIEDKYFEDGRFFDGCAFLSIVYGGEHLARLNFRNFFLQQVSDCEMSFNKDGNLEELTSLNPDGGSVRFHYKGGSALYSCNGKLLLLKMDVRERQDEEEVTDFQYEMEGDNLVREIQQIRGDSWGDTINYLYESNRLVRAESNYRARSNYYVDYLLNGRIASIHFPKYDHGQDLVINIDYETSNYISSVDWDKGSYGKAHIEFTYKLDSPRGNWFERNAIGTIERNDQTIPFSIRTVREYEYY